MSDCHICRMNAEGDSLPARERLYVDEAWGIAHGWSSLPGWLVVTPRRHVEALHELTNAEAAGLGVLLHTASGALQEHVGCSKTYVMLFTEHPRYRHLHVHVVPRMDWFGENDRAYRAFRFLHVPEEEQVSVEERERLAAVLGDRIHAGVTG